MGGKLGSILACGYSIDLEERGLLRDSGGCPLPGWHVSGPDSASAGSRSTLVGAMKTFANPVDRQSAVHRLAQLQPIHQARWGRMSAHQMLCHLSDSFRAVMGDKSVSPATGLLQRTLVKWVALNSPFPWPRGVPTRPEMDQFVGGPAPVEFDADRKSLVVLIDRFSNPQRDFEWTPHPIFGPMQDPDWRRWGYLHTDHHLRQFGL